MKEFLAENEFEKYGEILDSQLYKLFIDASRWDDELTNTLSDRSLRFDIREPGYMSAMMSAFKWGMVNIRNGLTSDFLEELQSLAVENVKSGPGKELMVPKFRQIEAERKNERFGLVLGETLSKDGFNGLILKMKNDTYKVEYDAEDSSTHDNLFSASLKNPRQTIKWENEAMTKLKPGTSASITLHSPSANDFIKKGVEKLVSIYNNADKSTLEKKQDAIIALMQDLDQLHPCYDGNIRSFVILLPHILLAEDKEAIPPCFMDPNCFDCLSRAELKVKYAEAQNKFLDLCDPD